MVNRKFKASPVKVTGLTPDGVPFESSLEEDQLFLLRFNSAGIDSISRPTESIVWRDKDGKLHRYTPDLLIRYRATEKYPDGVTVLGEVKPDFLDEKSPKSRLRFKETDDERARKWTAAHNYATLKGWVFRVFRESSIRTPFLRNVKFLIKHLELPRAGEDSARIREYLKVHGSTPIGKLMHALEPVVEVRAALYPALWGCVAKREVAVDLESMLTLSSTLSLPQ